MSSPLVKFSYRSKSELHERLRALKKMDMPAFVQWMGKVACQTLLKWTAPHGKNPEDETWPEQKKLGQNAVKRDIDALWRPANGFAKFLENSGHESTANDVRKYIRQGRTEAIKTIAAKFKLPIKDVIVSVTEQGHDMRRNAKTGNVISDTPTLVLRSNSLSALRKKKLSHVGKLKSGWGKAAAKLNVSFRNWPKWVRDHGKNGRCVDHSSRSIRPTITLINDMPAPTRQVADMQNIIPKVHLKLDAMARYQIQAIMDKRFGSEESKYLK